MGLTFHYTARISDHKLIDEMNAEVEDICKSLDWKYYLVNDEKLKGIVVSPKDCEPLSLSFAPNGRLCGIINTKLKDPGDEHYYSAFTKTQFAGPDIHMALLKLLSYLARKYFSEIDVIDEGMYWNVWDKKVLLAQFAKYNDALHSVISTLEQMSPEPGEATLSFAERLEKYLRQNLGGQEQ